MNKTHATKRVPLTGPDDHRHGTDNCYTYWKCRCDRCKAAHATAARAGRGLTPLARCPVCGARATDTPVTHVQQDGVTSVTFVCTNPVAGHLWETRWVTEQDA